MSQPEIPTHVPMSEQSYYPLLLAAAILLIAIGILSTFVVSVVGAFLLIGSLIGWTLENRRSARREGSQHE